MGQTIAHYTLLTDIDLLKVSKESIFFRSDRKLFQATASLQENDFFSEFEFVLEVLKHLQHTWYRNRVLH